MIEEIVNLNDFFSLYNSVKSRLLWEMLFFMINNAFHDFSYQRHPVVVGYIENYHVH